MQPSGRIGKEEPISLFTHVITRPDATGGSYANDSKSSLHPIILKPACYDDWQTLQR